MSYSNKLKSFVKSALSIIALFSAVLLVSCDAKMLQVDVSNDTDVQRDNELVSVEVRQSYFSTANIGVVHKQSNKNIPCQIDSLASNNGTIKVMFQVNIEANSTESYFIVDGVEQAKENEIRTFARIAPERMDDFAWENDKVAFRTYGPEAKELYLAKEAGGLISSGVDCWLKKVDYPIINRWYKNNVEAPGSYHIDSGEGLDNYHVGISRGCGGTGVFVNGELHSAHNFAHYSIQSNGPLQTRFKLMYEPYSAGVDTVVETKAVSINLGDHLTKYSIEVSGVDSLTVGIAIGNQLSAISEGSLYNGVGVWASHHGSELGTAALAHADYYAGHSVLKSDEKDKSHVLLHLKVIDGKVVFYSGFTWIESGHFESKDAWEAYLIDFKTKLENPLKVLLK